MIHAGRLHLVRTLADLAAVEGKSLGTYKNNKMHKRPGHPRPISSRTAKTLLYDGEQVDAYRSGTPIPELGPESPDDLLDPHEGAALVGVSAKSWETYRKALDEHVVTVQDVEHLPRHIIQQWKADRPGRGAGGGRNVGTRDAIPRQELDATVAELLKAKPDITAREVVEQLGIHPDTAYRVLSKLRAAQVQALLHDTPDLTAEQVVERLGFHVRTARTALRSARDSTERG
ncbi:hypothetical protein [Streptomyces sp. NPDC057966]|uniref:hypothetical protein n=1 Tax=Streptomyces sp. NPDC057966 TaxID=3346292 RepID=UPI0036EAB33A